MPIFVFVGNPLQKVVKDRETGKARAFKADREEADTITVKSRDGKVAVHFTRDHPVRVENASLVARLRGNNHFKEVKAKVEAPPPPKAPEPVAPAPAVLPVIENEADLPVAEVSVDQPQQEAPVEPEPEEDPDAPGGVVRMLEEPQGEVTDGAVVSDAG